MKKIFNILVLSCLVTLFYSCGDGEIELGELNEDYIVFGHYFGECFGEGCVETYALTSDKLYEDTNDKYRGTDFEFVELDQELFEKVKDIPDHFPTELLAEEDQTFGCPDCGDWGGLLIQYVENGNAQTWYIDLMTNDTPEYLHDFTALIQDKIGVING